MLNEDSIKLNSIPMDNHSDKPPHLSIDLAHLSSLQDALNYHFKDKILLLQALTHSSFAYESTEKDMSDNQRLEFLGDSILNMVTAEYLYEKHPTFSEGELTRLRALLVNRDNLFKKASQINLGQYLLLGKGEKKSGGRQNPTNLVGSLEAIIAAIYLDSDFNTSQRFIVQMIIAGDNLCPAPKPL